MNAVSCVNVEVRPRLGAMRFRLGGAVNRFLDVDCRVRKRRIENPLSSTILPGTYAAKIAAEVDEHERSRRGFAADRAAHVAEWNARLAHIKTLSPAEKMRRRSRIRTERRAQEAIAAGRIPGRAGRTARKVVWGDQVYDSPAALAAVMGCHPNNIYAAAKRGWKANKVLYYLGDPIPEPPEVTHLGGPGAPGQCLKYRGRFYKSIKSLADALGVHSMRAWRACQRGKYMGFPIEMTREAA